MNLQDADAPDRLERVRALGLCPPLEAPKLVLRPGLRDDADLCVCVSDETVQALRAYLDNGAMPIQEPGARRGDGGDAEVEGVQGDEEEEVYSGASDLEANRMLEEVLLDVAQQMGGSLGEDARQLELAQGAGDETDVHARRSDSGSRSAGRWCVRKRS